MISLLARLLAAAAKALLRVLHLRLAPTWRP